MFNRIKDGMYWDRAWKLVEGCTPVSKGCAHCWSARETHMRAGNPNAAIAERNKGLTQNGWIRPGEEFASPFFNGKIRLRMDNLDLPLRTKTPTVWAIWNDLFHDSVAPSFINAAMVIMGQARQHIFMVLTKRPDNMRLYFNMQRAKGFTPREGYTKTPLPNLWLGVTAENQEQADKRIPILLQTPAAHRYVSIEPMLGPVNLAGGGKTRDGKPRMGYYWLTERPCAVCRIESDLRQERGSMSHPINCGWSHDSGKGGSGLDWVICGGESGPGARPMHPAWARSLRDECQSAGVPFFFKQWGEWFSVTRDVDFRAAHLDDPQWHIWPDEGIESTVSKRIGKTAAGRMLDGKEYLELPTI